MVECQPEFDAETAARAVVAVGNGRGVVMELRFPPAFRQRVIVTAAHCLPGVPPIGAIGLEATYIDILGPLGDPICSIAAECVFVDLIADIAVLAVPEEVGDEAIEAFEEFTDRSEVNPLGEIRQCDKEVRGWLLSLDGQWSSCTVRIPESGPGIWTMEAHRGIQPGMSGSPILLDNGNALGVLSCTWGPRSEKSHTYGGPHPHLMLSLPWLVLSGAWPSSSRRKPRRMT